MPSVMCPKCSAKLNLSKIVEGARITCPSCGHKFPLTKNAGRAGAVADPEMEDELKEDSNFFGDDPVVWIKIGGFCALLLLPMFIVLIWNLSRRPSYLSNTAVAQGQVMPVDHQDKVSAGAHISRDGETINLDMKMLDVGEWQPADWSILDRDIKNQEDKRLGVWKIRQDGESIEEGWDIITIQEPLDSDVPPLPFMDGFISGFKIGLGYSTATIELYATESRGDYNVRATRVIQTAAVTLPLRTLPGGGWGEDKNRPNGIFRVSTYFPKAIVDQMPYNTENFRDTYELVVRVRPGKVFQNAYGLVSDKDAVITYRGTELYATVEYKNVTDKTLVNPCLAVDLYDKDTFLIGTYIGDGQLDGHSIAPGETVTFRMTMQYPEGKKPENTDRNPGWTVNARGFAIAR